MSGLDIHDTEKRYEPRMKKTAKEITCRTEGEMEFVHVVFQDGSMIDLKGPRSGMKTQEREENGAIVIDCEFEGFTLAE